SLSAPEEGEGDLFSLMYINRDQKEEEDEIYVKENDKKDETTTNKRADRVHESLTDLVSQMPIYPLQNTPQRKQSDSNRESSRIDSVIDQLSVPMLNPDDENTKLPNVKEEDNDDSSNMDELVDNVLSGLASA
ncbi:hypothetical protein RFI_16792, partial [Reticulomyxa filosa]